MSYIDAIVHFCEMNSIDVESVPKLISKPLKEKLKYEAMELNFLKENFPCQIAPLIPKWGEKISGKIFVCRVFLVMPFDAYKSYLSLKNHFTKEKYDYHKYCGKSRATVKSFYKRKDRFWFEKLARNKSDKEVIEFFVSNFIDCTDPAKLWIGEMIREGEDRYVSWKKRTQSLSYLFKEETDKVFGDNNF